MHNTIYIVLVSLAILIYPDHMSQITLPTTHTGLFIWLC